MTDFASKLRGELAEGRRSGQFECTHNELADLLYAIDSLGLRAPIMTVTKSGYRVSWFDPRPAQKEMFTDDPSLPGKTSPDCQRGR